MELLSPAGNMEKLKAAVLYGADAVYFGTDAFSLRAKAGNIPLDEIPVALEYLHERGKKGYLTLNSFLRDYEEDMLIKYAKATAEMKVDGFIVSDPGVFSLVRRVSPEVPVSISTQANTTNSAAVRFWAEAGARRVILARELSREELSGIVENSPIEVEMFCHGAICISYSGRCLISAYMAGRDANRGECAQPCRWNYTIQEATRDDNMEIEEDRDGTYLYNAKDLALIDRVGELFDMGVASLKIEGRMKSVMYVAVTTAVYRKAIDEAKVGSFSATENMRRLLSSVSNRHYTEGFYSGRSDEDCMNYASSAYVRGTDFVGVVEEVLDEGLLIDCRGRFKKGENLSFFTPDLAEPEISIDYIECAGEILDYTKPGQKVFVKTQLKVPEGSILRRTLEA